MDLDIYGGDLYERRSLLVYHAASHTLRHYDSGGPSANRSAAKQVGRALQVSRALQVGRALQVS